MVLTMGFHNLELLSHEHNLSVLLESFVWRQISNNTLLYSICQVCPKFDILIKITFLYNIWKDIDQSLLPNRFCGRKIFTFPESLLLVFPSCEPLTISTTEFCKYCKIEVWQIFSKLMELCISRTFVSILGWFVLIINLNMEMKL